MTVAWCVALAACYVPHIPAEPTGTRVELGCVALGVAFRSDDVARGPIVVYRFVNRCDHRAVIDLASVRVLARDTAGREVALAAYDPDRELRALPLPARLDGVEAIEYRGLERADIASLCVDVGGIAAGAPRAARWICDGAPR